MRRLRVIGIFVIVVAVILTVAPFFTGMYFQREYKKILALYNTSDQFHIDIIKYNREWFHSKAIIRIKINPEIINQNNIIIPQEYILDQHIQHGPIIYFHADGIPYIFGLAAIHNTVIHSEELDNFLNQFGLSLTNIEINNDFITYNGNYYKHFKLSAVNKLYPLSNIKIRLNELESEIWLWPARKRISGNLELKNLIIADDQASINIPQITFQFDHDENLQNFWLGDNAIHLSEVIWIEEGVSTIEIKNINLNGFIVEKKGLLHGTRQFDVSKIKIDNEELGPFHLQISVDKLDAKAANDLFQMYQKIKQRGELYESQLERNIYLMLPNLITSGASIKLDELEVTTPDGNLKMYGEMAWPIDKTSIPNNLLELIFVANSKLDLTISKKLTNKWIGFAANFSLFNRPSRELYVTYKDTREEMLSAIKNNSQTLIELVRQNVLTDKEAIELLTLQKQMVSMEEYSDVLQKLLLQKAISLQTNHILLLSYMRVQKPLIKLDELLKKYQENTQKNLQAQLDDWLSSGYIKQEQNNYIVTIFQKSNNLKINEKVISY